MFLSRMGLGIAAALMGLGSELGRASKGLSALGGVMRNTQASHYKSKPNRISQAKRRKYKRQGRE